MPRRRGGGGRNGRCRSVPRPEDLRPAPSSSPLLLLLPLVEALQECLSQPLAVREHLLITRTPRLEFHDLDIARRVAVGVVIRLGFPERAQALLSLAAEEPHHIRKMPNVVSGIGAFNAEARPSASTRRVPSGSMTPSSQRRAVE